jgi:transcriptional antiterminator RfaH
MAEEHLLRQSSRIGVTPFNPKVQSKRVERGSIVTRTRSYLPGYIFAHFDPDLSQWRSINGTRGVKSLMLSDHETPARVRDQVVFDILALCKGDMVQQIEADDTLRKYIPVGSMAKITDGAFEGHAGRVELSDFDRVRIVLSIFGRPTPVVVPPVHCELVALA